MTMTRARLFLTVKYGLYALLALNIALFFRHATAQEGLDSLGWLILLAVFEVESASPQCAHRFRRVLQGGQAVAYALVIYAWLAFMEHGQWLDAANATCWFAVAASIEADLHLPPSHPWRAGRWHRFTKRALYALLLAFALIWGLRGHWLDTYDATLWIICYAAVEMNLLRRWLLG